MPLLQKARCKVASHVYDHAEYTGLGTEKLVKTIMQYPSRQTSEVLETDPVASAIRDYLQKKSKWTGTTSELLELQSQSQPTPRPEGWSKQPNGLSRKLNILRATLNDAGITIQRDKHGQKRDRKPAVHVAVDGRRVTGAIGHSGDEVRGTDMIHEAEGPPELAYHQPSGVGETPGVRLATCRRASHPSHRSP